MVAATQKSSGLLSRVYDNLMMIASQHLPKNCMVVTLEDDPLMLLAALSTNEKPSLTSKVLR